jgi:hyperosmotically inducible periplasmic protein
MSMQFVKIRNIQGYTSTAAAGLILLAATASRGQQPSADNSAHNKQQQVTADQQSSTTTDRQLTAKIRKSLIADKALSMYAHNVKIITQNGSVTLKGRSNPGRRNGS